MTSETVAGERAKCSASFFRLMGLREEWPVPSLFCLDFMLVIAAQSRTSKTREQDKIFGPRCGLLDNDNRSVFDTKLQLLY